VNLLSNPLLWQSTNNAFNTPPNYIGPPPEFWDVAEQAYLFLDNPTFNAYAYSGANRLQLTAGAFSPGDTIEGTFTALTANGAGANRALRLYDAAGIVLQSVPFGGIGNLNVPIPFSFPAGEGYSIGPTNGNTAIYGGQFRIDPSTTPPCYPPVCGCALPACNGA
jgi:hypothetical protein